MIQSGTGYLILLMIFCQFSLNPAHAQFGEVKEFYEKEENNPGNLRMYSYLPEGLSDTVKYPLVVVLHGCSQFAKQISDQTGWSELAEKNKFIVIYPEQKRINNPNGCFNWFHADDIEKGKGESYSILNMIRYTIEEYNIIDTNRIFIYGLSAGAAMSVVMMACYPEYFNTGAVLAGGPYKSVTNPLNAIAEMQNPDTLTLEERGKPVKEQNPDYNQSYPKLIVMHGEKDLIVNPENSNEIIKQWSFIHQMDCNADTIIKEYDGKAGFTRCEYQNEKKETLVIKYNFQKLGHTLAVDPGDGEKQGGKKGMFAKDVDLFSTWYIARDFGLLLEK